MTSFTNKSIYIPEELLLKILDFSSKSSVMNLSLVNKTFYRLSKQLRKDFKNSIYEYICNDNLNITKNAKYGHKDMVICRYIRMNNISSITTLLQLNLLHPNQRIASVLQNHPLCIPFPTAVQFAVYISNKTVIKLFLDYGCDINKGDYLGFTPLMICARNMYTEKNFDLLIFLLEHGADPNIQNTCGYIAMDYIYLSAIRESASEVLRNYGSREGTFNISYESDCDLIDNLSEDSENYNSDGDYGEDSQDSEYDYNYDESQNSEK